MLAIFRIVAVLLLVKPAEGMVKLGQAIYDAMSTSRWFPNPRPALASLRQAIQDLLAADAACESRTKGTVEARRQKRTALIAILEHLRDYVQEIADANPADAQAIILSAGMRVRKARTGHPKEFEAKQGSVSGEVTLFAKRTAKRASYDWQYSTDQKSWVSVPSTLQAKTTIHGLTPGTMYYYRFRTVTKAGVSDWSQVVSLIVK